MNWHKSVSQQRDSARTVVLLPGWATDWHIFEGLRLDFNQIVPEHFAPVGFADGLSDFLKKIDCGPVTILGWSLGGFAAVDFASAYPNLVSHLVLVGIRRRYPAQQIEQTRQSLLAGKQHCLTEFYSQCFLPSQKDAYLSFSDELMPRYLAEIKTADLLDGLDYLSTAEINPEKLSLCRTTIVHGMQDLVAPPEEAQWLSEQADEIELHVLASAAHAAFLDKNFEMILRHD